MAKAKFTDDDGNVVWSKVFWELGISVLYMFWMIGMAFYRAWAITLVWAWFIVPGFGAAPLALPVAFGLTILHGFFGMSYTDTIMLQMHERLKKNRLIDENLEKIWKWAGSPFITTGLLWSGWLWHAIFAYFGVL